MTDIIQDLADVLADMDDGIPRDLTQRELYLLLSRAVGAIDSRDREIERLREANSDMGWRLNPDRMGGQFTEEEKNRSGWI
jgi:hypothetical protein